MVNLQDRVFISFASADRKVARAVCEDLEKRGFACWISSRDVRGGENYQEAIVQAIRRVKVMVLVFSEGANGSNEIKKELALASQTNTVVIPFRVENAVPNAALLMNSQPASGLMPSMTATKRFETWASE